MPLQQSLPVAQPTPIFLHAVALHLPSAPQKLEQHCALLVQVVAEPFWMHGPEIEEHWSGVKMPHA